MLNIFFIYVQLIIMIARASYNQAIIYTMHNIINYSSLFIVKGRLNLLRVKLNYINAFFFFF